MTLCYFFCLFFFPSKKRIPRDIVDHSNAGSPDEFTPLTAKKIECFGVPIPKFASAYTPLSEVLGSCAKAYPKLPPIEKT